MKVRHGDIFQIFIVLIIILATALFGLLATQFSVGITQGIRTSGVLGVNTTASNVNDSVESNAVSFLDEFVFFLFLGLNIGLIIAATRTNFSPTVIVLFILLMLIAILVASGFVEIYTGFSQNPAFSGLSSHLTLTNVVFSKYTPLFITILSAIIIILMYGKSGNEITP